MYYTLRAFYEVTQAWPIMSMSVPNTLASSNSMHLLVGATPGEQLPRSNTSERFPVFGMQRPEGPQRSRVTADSEVDRAGRATVVAITATAEAVGTAAAEATEMDSSAGGRNPVTPEGGTASPEGGAETSGRDEASPEGGAAGRDDEIARPKREIAEMSLWLDVTEEERTRMERL